ncbi:Serpin B4 like protein [Argiope bruennichi]|uniref:Serpin B4 like protein n=1 Tax=Argiope bruennichi TaxID=94029 RepID=A0A8T0EV96_ARGBR|nr:Serpin B4 like protein [Argiope bruennichi]
MGIGNLLFFIPLLAVASSQSLNDPWLRDPLLVGLWKLTRAINGFGFNLFEDLVIAEEGNVLICPYSLATALGILHFGSEGDTEKELSYVLGYEAVNLTKDEAAQTFYLLSTKHLKSSNPKLYFFDAPSTIVVNRKNGVLPTFQRTVEVLFQAPVTVSDFVESGEELIRSLNEWVAARTKNKIHHIIYSLDPFSDMIILNAAFFKGSWMHKFSPQATQPGVFYNYGELSKPRSVQMMRMTEVLSYHKDQHHSVLELPFKGRNVSMIIFLPDSFHGIEELQYQFSPEFFEQQVLQMIRSEVEVILPKFKVRFGEDLTAICKDWEQRHCSTQKEWTWLT